MRSFVYVFTIKTRLEYMIRILIAESEEAMRILLIEELQEEGYEAVGIPPEFLPQRLMTEEPHLILMQAGCTLPRLSGLQSMDLPLLVYSRYGFEPAGGARSEQGEAMEVAFDLELIKAKIRELLYGHALQDLPRLEEAEVPPYDIPYAQMHFDFSGWKEE